jgi:hypothetical protein
MVRSAATIVPSYRDVWDTAADDISNMLAPIICQRLSKIAHLR